MNHQFLLFQLLVVFVIASSVHGARLPTSVSLSIFAEANLDICFPKYRRHLWSQSLKISWWIWIDYDRNKIVGSINNSQKIIENRLKIFLASIEQIKTEWEFIDVKSTWNIHVITTFKRSFRLQPIYIDCYFFFIFVQ